MGFYGLQSLIHAHACMHTRGDVKNMIVQVSCVMRIGFVPSKYGNNEEAFYAL
jgi:hypothetical protein